MPSSFRILRQLLSRLEDERTGEILSPEFQVEIPDERLRQARTTATVLGQSVSAEFPFQPGAQALTTDIRQLLLNRTWRPQLEITGAAGLPALEQAGNVLRPVTAGQGVAADSAEPGRKRGLSRVTAALGARSTLWRAGVL